MKLVIVLWVLVPSVGVPAAMWMVAAPAAPATTSRRVAGARPESAASRYTAFRSYAKAAPAAAAFDTDHASFASDVERTTKEPVTDGEVDAWSALIPDDNADGNRQAGTAVPTTQTAASDWDKLIPADIDPKDLPPEIDPKSLPGPIAGSDEASIDEFHRFAPTERPDRPEPVVPPLSTPDNVDTNKPVHEWQRATDDWAGLRPSLEDRGVSLNANLTAEGQKNLRGGANTKGWDFRHLLNANLTLDTERLFGWGGGTGFVNFQQQHGQEGLDVGDAQGTSNIDADGRTQVSEAWYEQKMLGETLRVKLGKIDANTEFAFAENAAEFINSSMGFSPTILGLPTYPDPAFGAVVFVQPSDAFYTGFGIFDGSAQEGVLTGQNGPRTLFGDPSDLFLIGEAGTKWAFARGRDGRLGAGVWHHTGRFDRFDGGTPEAGTTGFYVVADQTLWRENPKKEAAAAGEGASAQGEAAEDDTQGLGLYVQYGYADADVSEIEHHVGAGLSWQGLLPTRDDDVIGLGVSYVRFSDAAGAGFGRDAETAIELFYKLQLTPFVSIKPDLQYVRSPGGDAGRDDALVATLRAVIDF